jgi:hypothetical protein
MSAIFHCYSELGHCCYSVQSFYNFINHFATAACGTEPGRARETKRCGAWDAQGVGSRGVGCGSVGQSVDRVQVMDLWSITLGDD